MAQIADFVFDLIFKPGTSLLLVPAINVSVLLLLGVLCFLTYTKIDPIHIVAMASLSVGLLLSVNWVYYEIQQSKVKSHEVACDTVGENMAAAVKSHTDEHRIKTD